MNDYVHNKNPKDPKLCQLIRKTITVNRKAIGLEFEDVAFELGLNKGTLENKLKPAMATSDMTITEFVHFLELTGDYAALAYMARQFGFILVEETKSHAINSNLSILVDTANMENADVFKAVKMAMSDGAITAEEKEMILKEIEEAQRANAQLKELVLSIGKGE
ncbi:MAG: hypothetical protein PHE67_11525 [Campylobacterales bacterium]|nr:hypothetical protein [Campylobacterales bacterium]